MRLTGGRSLGRDFRLLWSAYAVSTVGTWLAFDAFPIIAIVVLHAGPAAVSLLASAGLAVSALVAVPLGPWVEFRRKRPVMVAMDLARCVALLTVPLAFVLGRLSFAQLLIVSVAVGAADITFRAASGAFLKSLVAREDLLVANARFEQTLWTATALGPPLGGAAIGVLGPVTTVIADAVSYLLSAAGIRAVRRDDVRVVRAPQEKLRLRDLVEGWRYIHRHPVLRPLFLNNALVSGLILATAPLVAVLMLGNLGFAPWQYGLAFGAPCAGGLLGSRLSAPLATRFGRHRVLLTTGVLRACWSIGLAFIARGAFGLALVMCVQLGLVTCMGVFNPIYATCRLEQTDGDRVARVLSAWAVTTNLARAAMTALWGLLAAFTGPRVAIGVAGVLLLLTPLLLPRRDSAADIDVTGHATGFAVGAATAHPR